MLKRIAQYIRRYLPATMSKKHIAVFLILFASMGIVFFVINAQPTHALFEEVRDGILDVLTKVTLFFARLCMAMAIFFLRFFIQLGAYNGFLDAPIVRLGWVMLRDIANMFFVVALLVIAFATILGRESYEWKKAMVKLVLVAIVVNFSLLICGVVLDAAHVFTVTFINAIAPVAAGNLITMFNFDSMQSIITDSSDGSADIKLALFGGAAVALFFSALAALTIGAYCVILLYRMVAIWSLLIFSPLAFVMSVLPATENYFEEWKSEFTKNILSAPIAVFFLWLAFATMGANSAVEHMNRYSSGYEIKDITADANAAGSSVAGIADDTATNSVSINAASTWASMAGFLVAMAFLLKGIEQVQSLGVAGSGWLDSAQSFAKNVATIGSGVALGGWLLGKGRDFGVNTSKNIGLGVGTSTGVIQGWKRVFTGKGLFSASGARAEGRLANLEKEKESKESMYRAQGQQGKQFFIPGTNKALWQRNSPQEAAAKASVDAHNEEHGAHTRDTEFAERYENARTKSEEEKAAARAKAILEDKKKRAELDHHTASVAEDKSVTVKIQALNDRLFSKMGDKTSEEQKAIAKSLGLDENALLGLSKEQIGQYANRDNVDALFSALGGEAVEGENALVGELRGGTLAAIQKNADEQGKNAQEKAVQAMAKSQAIHDLHASGASMPFLHAIEHEAAVEQGTQELQSRKGRLKDEAIVRLRQDGDQKFYAEKIDLLAEKFGKRLAGSDKQKFDQLLKELNAKRANHELLGESEVGRLQKVIENAGRYESADEEERAKMLKDKEKELEELGKLNDDATELKENNLLKAKYGDLSSEERASRASFLAEDVERMKATDEYVKRVAAEVASGGHGDHGSQDDKKFGTSKYTTYQPKEIKSLKDASMWAALAGAAGAAKDGIVSGAGRAASGVKSAAGAAKDGIVSAAGKAKDGAQYVFSAQSVKDVIATPRQAYNATYSAADQAFQNRQIARDLEDLRSKAMPTVGFDYTARRALDEQASRASAMHAAAIQKIRKSESETDAKYAVEGLVGSFNLEYLTAERLIQEKRVQRALGALQKQKMLGVSSADIDKSVQDIVLSRVQKTLIKEAENKLLEKAVDDVQDLVGVSINKVASILGGDVLDGILGFDEAKFKAGLSEEKRKDKKKIERAIMEERKRLFTDDAVKDRIRGEFSVKGAEDLLSESERLNIAKRAQAQYDGKEGEAKTKAAVKVGGSTAATRYVEELGKFNDEKKDDIRKTIAYDRVTDQERALAYQAAGVLDGLVKLGGEYFVQEQQRRMKKYESETKRLSARMTDWTRAMEGKLMDEERGFEVSKSEEYRKAFTSYSYEDLMKELRDNHRVIKQLASRDKESLTEEEGDAFNNGTQRQTQAVMALVSRFPTAVASAFAEVIGEDVKGGAEALDNKENIHKTVMAFLSGKSFDALSDESVFAEADKQVQRGLKEKDQMMRRGLQTAFNLGAQEKNSGALYAQMIQGVNQYGQKEWAFASRVGDGIGAQKGHPRYGTGEVGKTGADIQKSLATNNVTSALTIAQIKDMRSILGIGSNYKTTGVKDDEQSRRLWLDIAKTNLRQWDAKDLRLMVGGSYGGGSWDGNKFNFANEKIAKDVHALFKSFSDRLSDPNLTSSQALETTSLIKGALKESGLASIEGEDIADMSMRKIGTFMQRQFAAHDATREDAKRIQISFKDFDFGKRGIGDDELDIAV